MHQKYMYIPNPSFVLFDYYYYYYYYQRGYFEADVCSQSSLQ